MPSTRALTQSIGSHSDWVLRDVPFVELSEHYPEGYISHRLHPTTALADAVRGQDVELHSGADTSQEATPSCPVIHSAAYLVSDD
jgi:hypothetical protein